MKAAVVQSNAPRQTARFPRRLLMIVMTIVVLHFVCAYALDAAGLVENLLSPSGAQLLWILPLAVFFYALRFATFFVVPGLFAGSLILWLVEKSNLSSQPDS